MDITVKIYTNMFQIDERHQPTEGINSMVFKQRKYMGNNNELHYGLISGQEATVRTGHGTTDWFQIGKGVHQGCILSPCLFNLYAEYIMRNPGLDEAQAGIKIARRNINNLRYADDEEGIQRAWTASQACPCWSCMTASPVDSELCA